jgi:hypothetical protein
MTCRGQKFSLVLQRQVGDNLVEIEIEEDNPLTKHQALR